MNKRTISSLSTFFDKFITPVGWAGATNAKMLADFAEGQDINWALLFFLLISSSFLYFVATRLKRVCLDDRFLYVSDYRREIVIPRHEISTVKAHNWCASITIYLRRPSEFGDKITFRSKSVWKWYGAEPVSLHPILDELRQLATRR